MGALAHGLRHSFITLWGDAVPEASSTMNVSRENN